MEHSMEGCVMLALSTFRRSEKAVDTAIQKAQGIKKLLLVYVADINLARYFVGAEHGLLPDLKDKSEGDMLLRHEQEGREHVEEITAKAKSEGIEVKTVLEVGRFAVVSLALVRQEKPSLIVTTRSERPEYVRKFFGSPVNELIEKAGCPVLVV